MDQKKLKNFTIDKEEWDLLIMQLDMETIAIGSPGIFKINHSLL